MGPIIIKMISDKQGNILVSTFQGVKLIDTHDANNRTVSITQELHKEGPSWVTSVAREKENLWSELFEQEFASTTWRPENWSHTRPTESPAASKVTMFLMSSGTGTAGSGSLPNGMVHFTGLMRIKTASSISR